MSDGFLHENSDWLCEYRVDNRVCGAPATCYVPVEHGDHREIFRCPAHDGDYFPNPDYMIADNDGVRVMGAEGLNQGITIIEDP